MSIDTNKPYEVPKEYEAKNRDFVPKTKPTSVVMIIIGAILIIAITVGAIIGIIFGVNKIIETIQQNNNQSETSAETRKA